MNEVVSAILDRLRAPAQRFFLIVMPDDAPRYVSEFTSISDLVAELVRLFDTDVEVDIFLGERFFVSTGPQRHLMTPYGAFPLHAPTTQNLAVEERGFLGRPSPTLTLPEPTSVAETAAAPLSAETDSGAIVPGDGIEDETIEDD